MSREQNIGKPSFSEVLRSEMEKRTVTQETVAQSANASQATVNGWLSGSIPRADVLHRLAQDWGVSMEYLLTGRRNETDHGFSVAEAAPPDTSEIRAKLEAIERALAEVKTALKKI